MIMTSTIMEIILSPRKEKGTINGRSIIQRSADKHTRRSSVTMVSYCRECLMTMYLSTWTMAKWESVKLPNTLRASLDNTVLIQYVLEVFPCSCTITQAIKAGWPITPIVRQISSRQAGECNVWLGFQSVFSLNSDYDQCIHNSCEWTSNDVDDGNEDKPTISPHGSFIKKAIRNRWITCKSYPLRLWDCTWIHIVPLACLGEDMFVAMARVLISQRYFRTFCSTDCSCGMGFVKFGFEFQFIYFLQSVSLS